MEIRSYTPEEKYCAATTSEVRLGDLGPRHMCAHTPTHTITVTSTTPGITVATYIRLCPYHYEQYVKATNQEREPILHEQEYKVVLVAPHNGAPYPTDENPTYADFWAWRPKIGETEAQRELRLAEDKVRKEAAKKAPNREGEFGPFQIPADLMAVAPSEVNPKLSFIQADAYTEEIQDMLVFAGNCLSGKPA